MDVPERQPRERRWGWRRGLSCAGFGALLLCVGLAWAAQRSRAAWDAGVEAELAALRAEGLSADFTAIHPTSPDPYSEALVRIGQGYQDLQMPSAVHALQGSGLGLLRAALADPDSDQARIAYPRFEEDEDLAEDAERNPPTLQAGIAALQSGCEFLDAAFDLLEAGDEPCSLPVPWEEGDPRALGPVLGCLNQVSRRLETRAALAWIAGDPERGWGFVLRALTLTRRHVRQPGLLGALLGTNTLQIRLGTVLEHLEAGPAPLGEQRAALLAELAALDELESLEFSLRGEVCDLLLAEDRAPAEAIRFGLTVDASPPFGLGPEVRPNPLTLRWLQVTELPRWRHDMVQRMAAALRLMHGAHPAKGYRSLQELNKQPATPLAAFGHYWQEAYRKRINAIAVLRLTRIALALAEGVAPPSLEDPWGPPGSQLRAERREAGGWLLWSRGCDGEDAGGSAKDWDWSSPDLLSSGVICEPGGLTDDGAGFDLVVFFAPPAPQSSKRKADQPPPK